MSTAIQDTRYSDPAVNGLWSSWNGLVKHRYERYLVPGTEEEIVSAVRGASHIRAFGNRQSSADISAGTKTLLDMTGYNSVVAEDSDSKELTVESGMRLSALIRELESRGWCLPCLPDIDTVTVGGALATGTHGTAGDGHILAEYMVACRIVTADGSVRSYREDDEEMMAALRCSLGLLGVFSTVTFRAHPLYYMRVVEEPVRDEVWLRSYRGWLDEHDFVRILWLPHTGYGYVVLGDKVDGDTPVQERSAPRYHRHRREVSKLLYRIAGRFPRFTVTANRLLRRLFFSSRTVTKGTLYGATVTKSRTSTIELAEWSVALDRFDELFTELKSQLDSSVNGAWAHIPMDVRFLRADGTWLSQAWRRDTVTVGCVTRNPQRAEEYEAFDLVEQIFLRYDGRPHWAKRFRAGRSELSRIWPKLSDFIRLRRRLDPGGRFLNDYLRHIFE